MAEPPGYQKKRFQCPHCGVVAKQDWQDCTSLSKHALVILHQFYLSYRADIQDRKQSAIEKFLESFAKKYPNVLKEFVPRDLTLSLCHSCSQTALWIRD